MTLSQQRFRFGDHGHAAERWAVPVVVEHRPAGGGEPATRRVLLDGPTATVDVGGDGGLLNANAGAHGFYRVRYTGALLDAVLGGLGSLTPLERYTVVDDAWASVLAGSTTADGFVALAERFADERDLSVWDRIVGGLGQIDRLLDGDDAVALHTRVATLIGPARAELGAEARPGEDDRTRTLRGHLLSAAALLADDDAARRRAGELLERFLAHPPSVDPSLASPALVVSATLGDVALHERLADRFRTAENPQDRERVLLSLSRFRDPEALRRTLELSLSGDVRTQDAPYLLRECVANRDNGPEAWAFVAANWPEIEKRFPANSLSRLVGGIRSLHDRALADEVVEFLAAHPIPQGELQVRQHIERMWVTVALAERVRG